MTLFSVRRVCALTGALWLLSACGVADAGHVVVDAGRGGVAPRLGVGARPTPPPLTQAQTAQVVLHTWAGYLDAYWALDVHALDSVATEPLLTAARSDVAEQKQEGGSNASSPPTATVKEAHAVGGDAILARISTVYGSESKPSDQLALLTRAASSAPWKVAYGTFLDGGEGQRTAAVRVQGPLDQDGARQLVMRPDELEAAFVDYLGGGQDGRFAPGYWSSGDRDDVARIKATQTGTGGGWEFVGEPDDHLRSFRQANGGAVAFFEYAAREHEFSRGRVCLKQNAARSNFGPWVPPGSYDEVTWEVRGVMTALVPRRAAGAQVAMIGGSFQVLSASTVPSTNPRCT